MRPGPGVIGRTVSVLLGLCAVFAVAVWAVSSEPYLAAGLAAFLAVVIYLILKMMLQHASKHPEMSIVEGPDVAKYLEALQATKTGIVIDATATPIANTDAPPMLTSGGSDPQ